MQDTLAEITVEIKSGGFRDGGKGREVRRAAVKGREEEARSNARGLVLEALSRPAVKCCSYLAGYPYWRSLMRRALCVSSGNCLRIASEKKMLDLREMGRKQHRGKTFVKSRQCVKFRVSTTSYF